MDGRSALDGRVEICLNNIWNVVCNNGWDDNDATVVCRQLGYSTIGDYTSYVHIACTIQLYFLLINV